MKTVEKRPFLSTAFFVLLGRAPWLALPFFIAMVYGAGRTTDAFFFTYVIIFYLIGIFSHIFESALIPYLAERRKSPGEVARFSNGVLLLSLIPAVIVGFLLWRYIAPFLHHWSGWDFESSHLVAELFLELSPILLLSIVVAAHNGIFYTYKIFWLPVASPMIRSLVVIVFMLTLSRSFGIHALTSGFAVGELIRWGITIFLLGRLTPWKFRVQWKETFVGLWDFCHQAFYQILALIAFNSLFLVEQFFASRLGAGNLSLLNYADRLLQIPYIFFMTGFLQVFLADWSDSYYDESMSGAALFWPKIRRDIRHGFIASLALGALLWLFRLPLIRLVYGHGQFSGDQLKTIADLFGWMSIGFVFGIVRLLYGRVLFVMKQAKFYCFQCWVEFLLNIALIHLLLPFFGVVGIAMAAAIAFAVVAAWSHLYFLKYHRLLQTDMESSNGESL